MDAVSNAYEFGKYLTEEVNVLQFYDALDKQTALDYVITTRHIELFKIIKTQIYRKIPFSLIRLGDGEGNYLLRHLKLPKFVEVETLATQKISCIMFGKNWLSDLQKDDLANGLSEAIESADFVGIPTKQQFLNMQNVLLNLMETEGDLRGGVGVTSVPFWLLENGFLTKKLKNPIFTNAHVHMSFYKHLPELLQTSERISLISSYPELLSVLAIKFGVTPGKFLSIPNQASNIKGTPIERHYPERFEEVIAEIYKTDFTGHLVLVAAGIPGKLYCNAVKSNGGMAIDIGSVADVWVGKGVRGYQNEVFVRNNKLL